MVVGCVDGDFARNLEPLDQPGATWASQNYRRSPTSRDLGLTLRTITNLAKIDPRTSKIFPEPSKIEPRGLQNRPWSHPRHHFQKTSNLRKLPRSTMLNFLRPKRPTRLHLGTQEAPKLRPKPEKNIVKKRHVFEIDFWVARAWFLRGFWMFF